MRKLKIWNGNVQTMVPLAEVLTHGLRHNSYVHAYGCAESRAALCRMIAEWSGSTGRGLDAYVRDYWSEGAWGDSMRGITREIGLWVQYGMHSEPVRVWPLIPKSENQIPK